MTVADPFPWPRLTATGPAPFWTGEGFTVGETTARVLAYGEASSHWTDDLTALHEAEAGHDHPIDVASRHLAVESMRGPGAGPAPVILDVGCSSGYVLENLRAAFPAACLIGADYLRGPLEDLARRMPRLPLLQFDLRQCPLPDACADGLTCLNVLEHIDDDDAAMRQLHRILKPGGIAHVEVPAGPELYDLYDEHLLHHRRYRLDDLVRLAGAAGFRVKRATHLGFLVYPAFWWVKQRNRRRAAAQGGAARQAIVAAQIRGSRQSRLLSWAVRLEILLGRILTFPAGIRSVVVLTKA